MYPVFTGLSPQISQIQALVYIKEAASSALKEIQKLVKYTVIIGHVQVF